MDTVEAPWTEEQVDSANGFQIAGFVHPFTCVNRSDGNHTRDLGDLGTLLATKDGWVCPSCEYTQGWAFIVMLDGSWKNMNPFDKFPGLQDAYKKLTDNE